jgi:hypothetical protein
VLGASAIAATIPVHHIYRRLLVIALVGTFCLSNMAKALITALKLLSLSGSRSFQGKRRRIIHTKVIATLHTSVLHGS